MPGEPERTEILWDTYGVPHIYASSIGDLFRAYGWAQMESHGNLLLRLYGQARARGAEYWGQRYMTNDAWLLTMGVPARAQEWLEAQNPVFGSYLDAFASGINAYADQHADKLDDAVEVVLPVSAVDVLAHMQHVVLFNFITSAGAAGSAQQAWQRAGSSGWAIGPSRSASGNAMLLANPHHPWSDPFVLYESQLTGPGFDAYGATYVGFPVLTIAFNDHLGWTHTVNTLDGADYYELTLSHGGYMWDGEVRAFETDNFTVRVKLDGGGIREQPLQVRRSIHGPVIAESGGFALALRIVGLDAAGMAEEWWLMARATKLREFEAALKQMQLPMFTVIYADREGHIMHLFNGLTPVRPDGPWDWSDVVPGVSSANLWREMHPYEELPRVLDPVSGWLQNSNDPPWTTTFPPELNPEDFPSYMSPRFMHFRAQRAARTLSEDEEITFDELLEYKHSTRLELAEHIVDDLIDVAREDGSLEARQAADVLAAWDRSADADSRGVLLFYAIIKELVGPLGPNPFDSEAGPFSVGWDPDAPLVTPSGLMDRAATAAAIKAAVAQMQATYGALEVPYGDVYRFRWGGLDLPGHGSADNFGALRTVWSQPAPEGQFTIFGGDTYVAIVEFSDPVRAMTLIGYGNASQPGSPHASDQLELFSRKQLRPVWRTRAEIEANLVARTEF